ncbi:MAG: hypothetical protein PHD26_09490 [Methanosarcinaceae archaeon]|nr:hypothetical protein [Methanosarcinaceae archaeon]MDD4750128.1 hypothetical protein [Methanosarcinaceae archaeon]
MYALRRKPSFALLPLAFLLLISLISPAAASADVLDVPLYEAPEMAQKLAEEGDLFSELSLNAELYNENIDDVPGLLKRFVGSEEIAGQIELENGEMLYVTLIMRSGKVSDFYKYETSSDPKLKLGASMTVKTDEETIRDILDSDEPYEEAVESMNDEELSVECKGLFKKSILWTIKHLP